MLNRRTLMASTVAVAAVFDWDPVAEMRVGIVYYADDPRKKVFRIVYPEFNEAELDGPVTDGDRCVMYDENGNSTWTTFGIPPDRVAIMERVPPSSPRARLGNIV